MQRSTNLGGRVTASTKFCTVAPNICGCSVWCFFHITLPEHRILRWLLDFSQICAPLRKCIFIYAHKKSTAIPCANFHENHKRSTDLCADLSYRISSKSKINVKNTDRISFTLLSKVWFPLRRFSRNPQSLNKFLPTSPAEFYPSRINYVHAAGKISFTR